MIRRLTGLWTMTALLWGLACPAAAGEKDPSEDGAKGPSAPLSCVAVKGEAKYVGYGYNHVVHLHNRCAHPVSCNVKTDVNPEAVTVALSKDEKKAVVTFVGSPARVFKPSVSCRKQ